MYLGLDALNARARASNFTLDELPSVTKYARERSVRVYVALNVLVFDEELRQAERLVRGIAEAGVDAVIVQDVGVARVVRETAPNLPIHGSTQMSVTSGEGARFARGLGCKRVVVGRELSLEEIAAVRDEMRGHRDRSLRARRSVRELQRAMFLERGVGRTKRQSRTVRAGVSTPLRFRRRR